MLLLLFVFCFYFTIAYSPYFKILVPLVPPAVHFSRVMFFSIIFLAFYFRSRRYLFLVYNSSGFILALPKKRGLVRRALHSVESPYSLIRDAFSVIAGLPCAAFTSSFTLSCSFRTSDRAHLRHGQGVCAEKNTTVAVPTAGSLPQLLFVVVHVPWHKASSRDFLTAV